jgi:hypothetical protein
VRPLTGLAIGDRGDPSVLTENYRNGDLANRSRKPFPEFIFGDGWGTVSPLVR